MKAFILCVTVVCIANVNGAFRPHPGLSLIDALISGRLDEATSNIHSIRDNHALFLNPTDEVTYAAIESLWYYCGSGNELLEDDLNGCLPTVIGWGIKNEGFIEASRIYISTLLIKFQRLIDWDLNGSLDHGEFSNLIAVLVATDARIIFTMFNADGDKELSENDLSRWRNTMADIWSRSNLYLTDKQIANMNAAFLSAHYGDEDPMTLVEVKRFIVQQWVILLEP